ncbi:MAG TPA: CHRD domain-containing protein [Pyrinomonadaceae bacterium]|nr:CHRD domain-containing protein [Pyrinomonadaceae bacterium]
MKRKVAVGAVMVLLVTVAVVLADGGFKRIREILSGFEEVPAISTTGNGEFRARIDKAETEIAYSLSYSDLQGTVTQAHIHLGQAGVNGGISAFLCSNLGNGPAGTQPCPSPPATITGTITAADVIGPTGQGISAGELDELIVAIRAGKTYVNVHSSIWPNGEIRSQIDHADDHDHENADKDK